MRERIRSFLSSYRVEKARGIDEKQMEMLPENIRRAMIHGSGDQAKEALADIRARERLQGTRLLGRAGLELITDMRVMVQQRKEKDETAS